MLEAQSSCGFSGFCLAPWKPCTFLRSRSFRNYLGLEGTRNRCQTSHRPWYLLNSVVVIITLLSTTWSHQSFSSAPRGTQIVLRRTIPEQIKALVMLSALPTICTRRANYLPNSVNIVITVLPTTCRFNLLVQCRIERARCISKRGGHVSASFDCVQNIYDLFLAEQ